MVESEALVTLSQIGERATLRYAVQVSTNTQRELRIDNLLVRIHYIIVMIR